MSNIKKVTKCPYCGKPGFSLSKMKMSTEILEMIGQETKSRCSVDGNFSREEMHAVYIFITEIKKRLGGER